ncbi:hypothetical protein HN803_03770 [candidate division WWE3 bacterium]|jgi:hypothetical protein|nr:hypothetical protein [candidate division WWE3 bacterium]
MNDLGQYFLYGVVIAYILFATVTGWLTKDKIIRIMIATLYAGGLLGSAVWYVKFCLTNT